MYYTFYYDLSCKYMILAKNSPYAKMRALLRKCAHFCENLMGPCVIPIACRILKLHQNLHNNMFNWNPKGFFETSIVKKMTVTLKPLTLHEQRWFYTHHEQRGGGGLSPPSWK